MQMSLFNALFLLAFVSVAARAAPPCSNVNVTELTTKSFMQNGFDFALKLMRLAMWDDDFMESSDGNLLFSPVSISLALGMLLEGAKGSTRDQIKTHLAKVVPDSELSASFLELINGINTNPKTAEYSVYTANKIYAQSKDPLKKEFMETLNKCFNSDAKLVDFTSKSKQIRKEVNKWVESKTDHKIHDLLPEGSVDGFTRFILANAIYLTADWLKPFTENSKTFEDTFHTAFYEEITVTYMSHGRDRFKYLKTDYKGEMVELPYVGGQLSMYIVLPEKEDGKWKKQPELEKDLFFNIDGYMKEVELQVTIPKFELEQNFPLKTMLKKMGMAKMFGDQADLSGINGQKNLHVTDAFHKAYIKVNENGTEAAAATGISGGRRSRPKQFKADRPFFFYIKHKPTNSILFVGCLGKPK